jgi:hypothetical protein
MTMCRRLLVAAITMSAWACADAVNPVSPVAGAPFASASADDAASAAFVGHRGVTLVEAYIDGRSELQIGGYGSGVMRWEHFDWAAPGRLNGVFLPTRVGPDRWYPQWPDVPDSENRNCHCVSDLFAHSIFFWPLTYDLDAQLRRGRGTASFTTGGAAINIMFDDNAFPGAEWYTVSFDTRFPLGVQPWPNQSPYVVSLSGQKYVSLALLSYGAGGLDDPARLVDFSLGDDRGLETGIARGPGGVPLLRVADLNGDTIDDAIVRFPVSGLVYHGDAAVGSAVLKVVARSPGWGYVRGDLPVTFVP